MMPSRRAGWVVLGMVCVLSAAAQQRTVHDRAVQDPDNEWHRALSASLTAWVPLCNADGSAPASVIANTGVPTQFVERAAGTFGQAASNVGVAASDTGQPTTSPSIATPPSGTGHTEKTSGSFGQTAGSTDTTAGSYGTTAGSFRGAPISGDHGPAPVAVPGTQAVQALDLALRVRRSARVRYVGVECDKLTERLEAAGGPDSPDLLLGTLPSSWTSEVRNKFLLPREHVPEVVADGLPVAAVPSPEIPLYLLRDSPNPMAARALVMQLTETCVGCTAQPMPFDDDWKPIHDTAQEALDRIALGSSLGPLADPEFAEFLRPLGLQLSVTEGSGRDLHLLTGAQPKPSILDVQKNGSLASVVARVVTNPKDGFGLTYSFLVLRKDEKEGWRVLHAGLNLPRDRAAFQASELLYATAPPHAEEAGGLRGVSLAAPPDGDSRLPMPDLWWDNHGGAGLQLVEWQMAGGGGWATPRLYFVRDRDPRLHTRQVAEFASQTGRYRWRVWSLGALGAVTLTPWRSFVIVSH